MIVTIYYWDATEDASYFISVYYVWGGPVGR